MERNAVNLMKMRNLKTRVSAVVLVLAGSAAVAPRMVGAQDLAPAAPQAPEVPPPAPNEPLSERPATQLTDGDTSQRDLQKQIHLRAAEVRREAAEIARTSAEMARARGELERAKGATFREAAFHAIARSPDAPVVISTRQLDAAAQAELREDLKVMDKLIRDEAARAGAGDPQAMSIKLTMVGRESPMYVEGAGAIFHANVNWPLAPLAGDGDRKDDRPRDPASKWERAKRQLSGAHVTVRLDGKPPMTLPLPSPVFEQARLDALRAALLAVLPEAANIRHLGENENVFITIEGIDDGGAPVRMTLKASKADIDAAAAGTITPAEFAQRIAQRIG